MTLLARLAVAALVCTAIVRGTLFLSSEPLLALANNHDMIRVPGCIDAYPVRGAAIDPTAGKYLAPLERYAFRTDVDAGCYFTSEVAFALLARPLMRAAAAQAPDGSFSVRIVGVVKFAALVLLLVGGAIGFWRTSGALGAIAFASVAAAVLTDPAVLIYANGFHAEYAAFLFLAGSVVLTAIALDRITAARSLWLLAGLCVLGLATSKVQHLALGLAIAAVVGAAQLATRRRLSPSFVFILLAALVGFALQLAHYRSDRTTAMQHANLTNTVIATLFAQSGDPHRTAERLGLPRRCGDHAGRNWYQREMHESPPCPEVFELSRLDIVRLGLREPGTLWRTYRGGFVRLRPWIPDGLGVVEGEALGRLPIRWFTWSRVLEQLGTGAILLLCAGPLVLVAGAFVAGRMRGAATGTTFAWLAMAALPFAIVGAVVFGDGYIDVPRQGTLVFACVLSFWTALAVCAVAGIARGLGRRYRERAWRGIDAARAAGRAAPR